MGADWELRVEGFWVKGLRASAEGGPRSSRCSKAPPPNREKVWMGAAGGVSCALSAEVSKRSGGARCIRPPVTHMIAGGSVPVSQYPPLQPALQSVHVQRCAGSPNFHKVGGLSNVAWVPAKVRGVK